jgi:type II secretory pathway pseudopilin PulG
LLPTRFREEPHFQGNIIRRGGEIPPGAADRGLTLFELLVSITVLLVALIGLVSVMYYTTRLNTVNRENLAALRAAELQIETLRALKLEEIVPRYNATTADDLGTGTNPGAFFDVEGLKAGSGGRVGKISFPGDGIKLLENVTDAAWGMPRDLNGNGVIDVVDVSGPDLKLLPVKVEITWTGVQGQRTMTYRHLIMKPGGGS